MPRTSNLRAAPANLAGRLRAVGEILLGTPPPPAEHDSSRDAAILLDLLVRAVQTDCSLDRVWLLCTAVFGAYPTAADVRASARFFQLAPAAEAGEWLVNRSLDTNTTLVRERQRVLEEELRGRIAARGAAFSLRYPQASRLVMRTRGGLKQIASQVPPLRRAALFSLRYLVVGRGHVVAARLSLRRRISRVLRPTEDTEGDRPIDHDVLGWDVGELRVVTDRVVVDVDHSARHGLHTGIQQVVRRTLPIWERDHALLSVAWTASRSGLRTLSSAERHRVLHWGREIEDPPSDEPAPALIVPWRTVLVLLETPPSAASERLAALAEHSGNAVVAVGYDCVPIVSADLVPAAETQRFARYLTALKYARRVAAISNSARVEFSGFVAALPAQGLPGPAVVECTLPAESPAGAEPIRLGSGPGSPTAGPLVLSVGSVEPRKNHLALLYAAERLWRDQLRFELLLIAGSGWGDEVPQRIAQLRDLGRPVTARTGITDTELAAAYQQARFTVFTSLHEGYGLPVAESLAFGTPVITTNYGSTNDIAASGGALLVDPRDDEALVEAMRSLLTDDNRLQTLRHQIDNRPTRTWEHYAAELWQHLVQPELPPPPPGNQPGPHSDRADHKR
jgi:glycosyltransferase involved in cell wall biosynthesis